MSGLLTSLNIAASGLRTTQASIAVVSENVANAQTPNYADRTAVVTSLPGGGGVTVSGVQRATDTALQQESLAQSSVSAGDAALSGLYQQLDDVTGGSSTTPALSTAMTNFQTAWQSFEASPDESVAAQQVISDGQAVSQTLGTMADGVQQLTATAQSNVATDVTTLNTDLANIASLNQQIVAAQATNTPVPDLEDERDTAVAAVANLTSINTVARPDGSLSVFTPNGLVLVDNSAVSLSWDGTNITVAGSTAPVNSSFQNGSIGATLGFLATDSASVQSSDPNVGALQKVTDQLNDFAASFYDTAAATPPSFELAYDGAATQSGEQASSFFTTSDGSATANAFNLVVNPDLVNGTTTLKQASGTPIVAALTQTNQSLDAGGLSVSGQTYSGIADAIVANTSNNAATVTGNATSSAATATALSTQLSGQVGVNLDDEMTNLIVLQNSYSASARVVTTISDMMTSLLAIGQG